MMVCRQKSNGVSHDFISSLKDVEYRFEILYNSRMHFVNPSDIPILRDKQEEVNNFLETLLYYFKYREYSAKNIEMIILSFIAGRGYQYSADYKQ